MGENKVYEAFDKIHAEQELKENTKKFLEQYYEKEKKTWNFSFYKTLVPVLTALVIVFAGVTVRSQTVEAARIDLKNGPEISLSVNRWNKVIQAEGLSDEANQVLDSLDLEGMTYTDAVKKILEDESYWQDTTVESQIEVEVTCKNNQLGEEIQQEVTNQCEEHQYEKHQYRKDNAEQNVDGSSNCQNQENQTEEIQESQENCEENKGNAQEDGETQDHGNGQGLHDGSGKQEHGHNNIENHE